MKFVLEALPQRLKPQFVGAETAGLKACSTPMGKQQLLLVRLCSTRIGKQQLLPVRLSSTRTAKQQLWPARAMTTGVR
jgi:hypothetical protein